LSHDKFTFAGAFVSPTTNREATKNAIDKLQLADRTATGEGVFTALQAIAVPFQVVPTMAPARINLTITEPDGTTTKGNEPGATLGIGFDRELSLRPTITSWRLWPTRCLRKYTT
jgi:hypothetical protein